MADAYTEPVSICNRCRRPTSYGRVRCDQCRRRVLDYVRRHRQRKRAYRAMVAQGLVRKRVNVAQAAAIAGVSPRTIQNWMVANKIEWVRPASGKGVRIYVDTLLKVPRNV